MSEHMRLMHPVGGVKDRPFECSFCSKVLHFDISDLISLSNLKY